MFKLLLSSSFIIRSFPFLEIDFIVGFNSESFEKIDTVVKMLFVLFTLVSVLFFKMRILFDAKSFPLIVIVEVFPTIPETILLIVGVEANLDLVERSVPIFEKSTKLIILISPISFNPFERFNVSSALPIDVKSGMLSVMIALFLVLF